MGEANAVAIPADNNQNISIFKQEENMNTLNVPYKEAINSLLFLAKLTRPDIAYAVGAVSQYAQNPTKSHWNAVKRIIKYLKGTSKYGILLDSHSDLRILAYSDADFAGDCKDRKSTSGYILKIGNSPVIWNSCKQKTVALSTTESEYVAASYTVQEIIWLHRLLQNLITDYDNTPTLFVDNQSAIKLIKNPELHKRTKHIDTKYHFIRESFEDKIFNLEYLQSTDQLADICTKPLNRTRFETLRSKISVVYCDP